MHVAIIILLNIAVYCRCLFFNLVSDDAATMKHSPYNVRYDKIQSILIHTLSCLYIYIGFGASTASFVAALLFSVHPLGVQIPVWKGGQLYGTNSLGILIAIALAPWGAVAFLFLIPGIPIAIFAPLVFLFTKHWYLALFYLPLTIWGFKKIRQVVNDKIKYIRNVEKLTSKRNDLGVVQEGFNIDEWKWANLILVVKTFGYYALASLFPFKNGFYNSFLATLGSSTKETNYWYSLNRHFWGGLFAIILMAGIWWVNKFNYIGMGIMLFVLSLIPFMNFISVQQFTASRYAYLALAGFQVALIGIVSYTPILVQMAIYGSLFTFYLLKLYEVMEQYRYNDTKLIELNSEIFPENPRVWYFRYEYQLHNQNDVMAFAEAAYGLKHLPEDCQLWFGLAVASYGLEDYNGALEFVKNAEKFMILADRENMKEIIAEFRARVDKKLTEKWSKPMGKRRF